MNKYLNLAGIIAAPWWIITLLVFGSLEPGYSHLYKAVSELGAFGAENWIGMNLICFLPTGIFIILGGLSFRAVLTRCHVSKPASTWIILFGIMMAGAAIPYDPELFFDSPWTIAHAFFVLFGIIPFIGSVLTTPKALKNLGISSRFIRLFPLLIIPGFILFCFLEQGGLIQRINILTTLIWTGYLNWLLARHSPLQP